jgi:hypothetical protein
MNDYRVNRGEAREDQFTSAIEKHTSQVPSSAFLALALGSMALSAVFKAWNKNHAAVFVGQWTAPFLLFGIYNKMVKQHGSDAGSSEDDRGRERSGNRIRSGETSYRAPERTHNQPAGV